MVLDPSPPPLMRVQELVGGLHAARTQRDSTEGVYKYICIARERETERKRERHIEKARERARDQERERSWSLFRTNSGRFFVMCLHAYE